MKYCNNCGQKIRPKETFCRSCGRSTSAFAAIGAMFTDKINDTINEMTDSFKDSISESLGLNDKNKQSKMRYEKTEEEYYEEPRRNRRPTEDEYADDYEEQPKKKQKVQNEELSTMRCSRCDGYVDIDEERGIISCPYCGAKKRIPVSDDVRIAREKRRAEVELKRLEMEEKERERRHQEREKERQAQELRKSNIRLAIIFIALFAIGIISAIIQSLGNLFHYIGGLF